MAADRRGRFAPVQFPAAFSAWSRMDREDRLKRLRFRAWHRGTREADFLIGGFFDAHGESWDEDEMAWFEALLEEQDVDIMAWAIGTAPPPERFEGGQMRRLQHLNYIKHHR
jgi:antitoxin CptB